MKIFHFHPITRKRLRRFRKVRYAYYSFIILAVLYILSLGSELLCNARPLYLRYNGKNYFPAFHFYSEDTFSGNGVLTRPDYKELAQSSPFSGQSGNFMIFAPVPYGPHETLKAEEIDILDEVKVFIKPKPPIAIVYIGADFKIEKTRGILTNVSLPAGQLLGTALPVSEDFKKAVRRRQENRKALRFDETLNTADGRSYTLRMAAYEPHESPRETVRLYLEGIPDTEATELVFYDGCWKGDDSFFEMLPPSLQQQLSELAEARLAGTLQPFLFERDGMKYETTFEHEEVSFPFRPCRGHFMGLDTSGRDLFSRMVYGFRISLSFGLLLVVAAMMTGSLVGAVQGYYAGGVDIIGQRLIEIWQSVPFLYVLILMGSIFGRSFWLLLLVYALFNWVGISYYMRAEFLNLRKRPFVEAAQGLGVPTPKIILKHVLPNAMTPLVTFFPFSLVSAIGVLAALDYLGFGMPPGTPSWGEMLSQAQEFPRAWWLILFPSLALFSVMLLGVFVGEGLRNAFDPRQYNRLEG